MLALAVLLLQADPVITYECAGRPLKEVFTALESSVGHKLYVSAELAEQPVVMLIKNRPWREVQKDLAWCFRASWKNETLGRTDEDNRARLEAVRSERERAIEAYLQVVKRRTSSWGKWTDSELKALVGRTNLEEDQPRLVITQAASEILLTLGGKTIASLPKGAYFAYPPQKGERPFPADCLEIVRDALENERKYRSYFPVPPTKVRAQAILLFDEGFYTLALADQDGAVLSATSMNEYVEAIPLKPEGSDEPLHLSELSKEAIALRKSMAGPALKPTAAMVHAIQNPSKIDPNELLIGDVLLAIARAESREMVAAPSFLWTSRLAARMRLPVTSRQATGELMPLAEFERAGGQMRVRSNPQLGLSAPRAKLQEIADKMKRAKTSQELADAIFTTTSWDPGQAVEVLIPQRWLNRSIEASPASADISPFLGYQIGTRRVISLSPKIRAIIDKLLREDPHALNLERSIVKAPANFESPNADTLLRTYRVTAHEDLRVLPLRAFPTGLPQEVEVEILPPSQIDSSRPMRFFLGNTTDRNEGKRTYHSEYGTMLREHRLGIRKEMPAYFWTYGESGGTVKLRFPGGYWLAISASASAIHADEKPRPISELPAEFVRLADEYSKLDVTRGTPPPANLIEKPRSL